MSALPGEHLCAAHQGNHSHYDEQNCTICKLQARISELEQLLVQAREALNCAVGYICHDIDNIEPSTAYIAQVDRDKALVNSAVKAIDSALGEKQAPDRINWLDTGVDWTDLNTLEKKK